MNDWNPWDIPQEGPPCARLNCFYWKPMFKYMRVNGTEIPDGIACCQAPDMHHDFSCFKRSGGLK